MPMTEKEWALRQLRNDDQKFDAVMAELTAIKKLLRQLIAKERR